MRRVGSLPRVWLLATILIAGLPASGWGQMTQPALPQFGGPGMPPLPTVGPADAAGGQPQQADTATQAAAQAERDREEQAQQAQAAANAQAAAQAQSIPTAAAQAQPTPAAGSEDSAMARSTSTFGWVFGISMTIAAVMGVSLLLLGRRDELARAYYRSNSPHPAEASVRSALSQRGTSRATMEELNRALAELPPTNSALRQVRLEQAEALFRELESATRGYERQARRESASSYDDAAFLGSQEALALAAVALAKAKAASATARSIRAEEN